MVEARNNILLWFSTSLVNTHTLSLPFFDINSGCSRQFRRNYRFLSSNVRQTYDVRDVDGCESRCVQERSFDCRAFAFSYNSRGNSFRNNRNCELSDRRINDGGYGGSLYGSNTGYSNDQLSSDRVIYLWTDKILKNRVSYYYLIQLLHILFHYVYQQLLILTVGLDCIWKNFVQCSM